MPSISTLLPDSARTAGRSLLTAIARGAPPPPGYIVDLKLAVASLEWQPGRVVAGFAITDAVCSAPGIVFGGYVAALHDQIGGMVMFSVMPDGMSFVTSRLDTRFFRALRPGPATIVAEVVELTEATAQAVVVMCQDDAATSRSTVIQALRKRRTAG